MSTFFLGDSAGNAVDSTERTFSAWLNGFFTPAPKQQPLTILPAYAPGVPSGALTHPNDISQADINSGNQDSFTAWLQAMQAANPPAKPTDETDWASILMYGALAIGGVLLLSNLSGGRR